jgi:ATP-dependent Lhr-like helicase
MMGAEGEAQYGRRHFMELLSVFSSPPLFTVWHGMKELGQIELVVLSTHRGDKPLVLFLGGRSWTIRTVEWNRRMVWVEEATGAGKGGWLGDGLPLSAKMGQAQKEVLMDQTESPHLSSRGTHTMKKLRGGWAHLRKEAHVLYQPPGGGALQWITFGGYAANQAVASVIGNEGVATDTEITFPHGQGPVNLIERLRNLAVGKVLEAASVPDQLLEGMKFSECLPMDDAIRTLHERLYRLEEITALLNLPTVMVSEC